MPITRKLLRAKLHHARVSHADLEYEGSLTIPRDLLELTDIREYEAISVWNLANGARFETYAIAGISDTRDICVNGAAAHHAKPGDRLIIASFCDVPETELDEHKPKVVFLDENNHPKIIDKEIPGPNLR